MVVAVLSTVTDLAFYAFGVIPEGPLFDIPILLLAFGYRTIYTIAGGYVVARLAPQRPMLHAVILGLIGLVLGSIGAIVNAALGPAWYAWGIVVEALPCIWLGAQIYISQSARRLA